MTPAEAFEALAGALRGLPIGHIWRGYGSALFLELGFVSEVPRGTRDGKTWLLGQVTLGIELGLADRGRDRHLLRQLERRSAVGTRVRTASRHADRAMHAVRCASGGRAHNRYGHAAPFFLDDRWPAAMASGRPSRGGPRSLVQRSERQTASRRRQRAA